MWNGLRSCSGPRTLTGTTLGLSRLSLGRVLIVQAAASARFPRRQSLDALAPRAAVGLAPRDVRVVVVGAGVNEEPLRARGGLEHAPALGDGHDRVALAMHHEQRQGELRDLGERVVTRADQWSDR